MKTIRTLWIGMLGIIVVLTSSFDFEPIERSNYTAVIMTRTELEKSVAFMQPRTIEQIGKIYKKDSWIFITEKYKGIHVIDNTNPSLPVKTGFIRVPGCIDISMKHNFLYADNSVDLITLDMSALPEIRITGRIRNIFPEPLPPDLQYIPQKFSQASRPENTIIVEWKKIK